MNRELTRFARSTSVDAAGMLTVNAGKFSRAAVIATFEMLGGLETFTEWADENKSEFYTKMFGKVIGREVEHKASDSLEDILDILDGEAEEIVDVVAEEPVQEESTAEPLTPMQQRMARAARAYSANEGEV